MIAALVQRDLFVERTQFAVDARAVEAARPELFNLFFELAFAAAHDRREDHHALAFGQFLDVLNDLVGGLARHRPPAVVAMRLAYRGEEQPQVIVYLGDGADGRTRAAAGSLLFYRDGGRQPFDRINVRLFELFEELPRVSREGFDVAALALGVDRVEGQRGFAGTAQTRDDGQTVARYLQVDVFQVVLARAAHSDAVNSHRDYCG